MHKSIESLKLVIEMRENLSVTRFALQNKLSASDSLDKKEFDNLKNDTVDWLLTSLNKLNKKIEQSIIFVPIYNSHLCNLDPIYPYNVASLVVLIEDINRFPTLKAFQAYCGVIPAVHCKNDKVFKIPKGGIKNTENCRVIGNEKSKTPHVSYNERLKKVIIRIVNGLIHHNAEYRDTYNIIWHDEKKKNPHLTTKHVNGRAMRRMLQKFTKDLYREWIKIENEV